ncbi:hypothetical protein [Runella aurantiaca]|uniref:Secreted protein (Por secretion system target) n=1 Tax=Runella aurantiaca TaxID=2282308 RepID=A0A369I5R1_9BACT|nr:hypothetical protein [Runella aurantiaca]RDB04240.1 hypothetical protein DVG78_19830 [Runella aurantiaca]
MIKSFKFFLLVFFANTFFANAQNPPRIVIGFGPPNFFNQSTLYGGETVYFPCNENAKIFAQSYQGSSYGFEEIDYVTTPSGWNSVNYTNTSGGSFPPPWAYAYVTPFTGQQGTLTLKFKNSSTLISVNAKLGPPVSFSSTPGLYGANQSATYQVNVGNQIAYSDVTWQTTGGVRVNGSTSYTGGTSQTVSTTSFGGKLKVRSNNSCGGSGDWSNEIVVGTPYIASKTVNGSPAQSMNYVNGGAYLLLFTDNTATGADWNIDGGSGSISPYGVSCHAYPSPFMRLQATATNQFGSGESYMFYIQDNGYSGYRMASSNPVKNGDKIRVEFADAKYADDLVKGLTLYSEKEKVIWSLSKEEAKMGKFFKDKNFVEIDTGKLNKGVYYLHLQIADKKYIERLGIE